VTKRHPTDASVRSDVEQFCGLVELLKKRHYIAKQLCEDEQTRSLTQKTANVFFSVVVDTLIDHFFLEVAKLSDSARSTIGKCENFTIANILETVDWPPTVLEELRKLNESICEFRGCIKPARDKLLAHYDKETVSLGTPLGSFRPGEDRKVMDVLEQMCELMHKTSAGVTYAMPSSGGRCVSDLKDAMRKALAFNKLFAQSKGEEQRRLLQCLNDVDRDLAGPHA